MISNVFFYPFKITARENHLFFISKTVYREKKLNK